MASSSITSQTLNALDSVIVTPIVGQFIFGTSGNDTIIGGVGSDTIYGSAGNDTLLGGYNVKSTTQIHTPSGILLSPSDDSGVDTFVFRKGDGKDIINDINSDQLTSYGRNHEAVVFADVASTEVNISSSNGGRNIIIHYGNGDQVEIFYPTSGFMGYASTALQSIQFSDGVIWSGSVLNERISTFLLALVVQGSDGNDTLVGDANKRNIIQGGAGDDVLYGAKFNDSLMGGSGNDRLYAGAGFGDTLVGGADNDIYYIGTTTYNAQIIEAANEGIDRVVSYQDYSLTTNVEELVLAGTLNINGNGNDSANKLYGTAGNNVLSAGAGNDRLNGRGGQDTLIGGLGNDVYYISPTNSLTQVMENTGEGTDTVVSSVNYTLGANVENLTLSEDNGHTYTYYTGVVSAIVGIDGVCRITQLTETTHFGDALNGTGNSLNNRITGNSNNNIINGGKGNDTLTGGYGSDAFVFKRGDGQDVITDIAVSPRLRLSLGGFIWIDGNQNNLYSPDWSVSEPDKIKFSQGVDSNQLWFRHVGNDLLVQTIGTADQVTFKDWYGLNRESPVSSFTMTASDGKVLQGNEIENLVSAMAAFSPPTSGQTTLPSSYQAALAPVLAANWS